jgi:hypothetical protein
MNIFDLLANAAVLLPLLTFAVGYVVNEYKKRRDERIARRKYLVALCTEIELNTDSLEKSIREMPTTQAFRAFLQSGPTSTTPDRHTATIATVCYRPHLINNYLDHVFRQHVGVLSDLPDRLIKSIISYYGKLDWINLTVASIEKRSFASISFEGRVSTIEALRISMHETRQHGAEILSSIKLLLDPDRPV